MMATAGQDVELGRGFSARFVNDDEGREFAIRIDHPTATGERCRAEYVLEDGPGDVREKSSPRVRVEQRVPLTLDRPLGCARCGTVGWVVEGHWSDHGRRRSMGRHPTTTWSRGTEHATTVDVRPDDPDRFVTEWISS